MARPPVKAQELADALAAQIRAGELTPGSWLASERQLGEAHGLSRATARQAVQILAEDGLVEHVAGSGARVRMRSTGHLPAADADMREELAAVRRLLREADARLEAIENRLG